MFSFITPEYFSSTISNTFSVLGSKLCASFAVTQAGCCIDWLVKEELFIQGWTLKVQSIVNDFAKILGTGGYSMLKVS